MAPPAAVPPPRRLPLRLPEPSLSIEAMRSKRSTLMAMMAMDGDEAEGGMTMAQATLNMEQSSSFKG